MYRAKARQGLQVIAVHTVDNTVWSISSRVNPKGSLAMVTMLRREAATASYDGYVYIHKSELLIFMTDGF